MGTVEFDMYDLRDETGADIDKAVQQAPSQANAEEGEMSSFTTPLDVRKLSGGDKWMVLKEFEYAIGSLENPEGHVIVTKGFITDFASIPRVFWPVIGHPTGEYGKAAVIHDWLYQKRFWFKPNGEISLASRSFADRIFKEAMFVLGVKKWKVYVMWLGVRVGGWGVWRKYRRAE